MKRRVVVLLPLLLLLTAAPAGAATGDLGHDISYPQCVSGGALTSAPTAGSFGVVGVNGGRPYDVNTCLPAQAGWAKALPQPPMLYANSANPYTQSARWPASGARVPALCGNRDNPADPGCAYDYGWAAAGDALLTQAASQTAIDPRTVVWWIDVEGGPYGNSWDGTGSANAADLQGMVDRLRVEGVPEVGIYANGNDWPAITGDAGFGTTSYTRSTSARYRTAWAPYFAPRYPIEDGPVWFAGLGPDVASAQSRCTTASLTGGEKLLAQYDDPDSAYDGDYRCADRDLTAPTASLTAPATGVIGTATTRLAWTGADTGGSGLASYDVQRANAPYNGALGAWSFSRRLPTTAVTTTSPGRGATSCWYVRSRDAAGNVSALSNRRCVIMPLDDRDLGAGTGWTRTTGVSGWFNSSYSSSTRLGATLTRSGVRTGHLELIAYRCPSCGSVTVLLNGVAFRTVSLASATSGRVRLALPRFSLRVTTVTLRVATSGKVVRIDGLATSGIV